MPAIFTLCGAWHIGCSLNDHLVRVLYCPLAYSPFRESLFNSVYDRTWDVPCKPEHFFLSFSSVSQNSHEPHPWHRRRQLILRSVSWHAALPFLPGSVFPQHKSFFLFGCSELREQRAEWEGGSSGLSTGRQKGGVGESRCGWQRCYGEPFEGERKLSYFRVMSGGVAGIHSGG